jgi:hypothetical protein
MIKLSDLLNLPQIVFLSVRFSPPTGWCVSFPEVLYQAWGNGHLTATELDSSPCFHVYISHWFEAHPNAMWPHAIWEHSQVWGLGFQLFGNICSHERWYCLPGL